MAFVVLLSVIKLHFQLFKDLPIMAFVVLLSVIKLHFQLDKRELSGFN